MAKRKRTKIIYKTPHRKLKTQQHEPHSKLGVNSSAPEGLAVPAPHAAYNIAQSAWTMLICEWWRNRFE